MQTLVNHHQDLGFRPNGDWDSMEVFSRRVTGSDSCFFCFCFFNLFIYLFLAVLGLRCCTRALSSCGERGPLLVAVRGLLMAVAPLVAEHRL